MDSEGGIETRCGALTTTEQCVSIRQTSMPALKHESSKVLSRIYEAVSTTAPFSHLAKSGYSEIPESPRHPKRFA